jgi:hypothetical protein
MTCALPPQLIGRPAKGTMGRLAERHEVRMYSSWCSPYVTATGKVWWDGDGVEEEESLEGEDFFGVLPDS